MSKDTFIPFNLYTTVTSTKSDRYKYAELRNVTDMADISVYKYWNVGVKSVEDHAVL